MCLSAQKNGFKRVYIPNSNINEAKLVNNLEIVSVNSLKDLIQKINSKIIIEKNISQIERYAKVEYDMDFSEIYG